MVSASELIKHDLDLSDVEIPTYEIPEFDMYRFSLPLEPDAFSDYYYDEEKKLHNVEWDTMYGRYWGSYDEEDYDHRMSVNGQQWKEYEEQLEDIKKYNVPYEWVKKYLVE